MGARKFDLRPQWKQFPRAETCYDLAIFDNESGLALVGPELNLFLQRTVLQPLCKRIIPMNTMYGTIEQLALSERSCFSFASFSFFLVQQGVELGMKEETELHPKNQSGLIHLR